jgi:hypothetical protein
MQIIEGYKMSKPTSTQITLFRSNITGGEFEYKSHVDYECLRTGDYVVVDKDDYKELKEAFLKMYEISLRYADTDKVFLHNAICLREKYGELVEKYSKEENE